MWEEAQVAEREGFEPSIRFWRILTFQASAFDHSATAPRTLEARAVAGGCAKGKRCARGRRPYCVPDAARVRPSALAG